MATASFTKRVYTSEEVAKHNTVNDLWIILDGIVYDLTKFAALHPGGVSVLTDEEIAGQDATEAFFALHRQEVLKRPQYARLRIGVVDGYLEMAQAPAVVDGLSLVPYAEPTWLSKGFYSPYFSENHRRFQIAVRKFVDEIIFPDAQAREDDGKRPSQAVFDKMAEVNLIAMRLGPGKHLEGRVLMGGIVTPEEFDQFHELIIWQELGRLHARGYSDGLGTGTCIGLPPVLVFGSPELKAAILPDILNGQKFICLAVTEAFAGSDVAGLRCRASRVKGGWVVNGTLLADSAPQKWITNGTFADYFTVACRSDQGKIMVLVVPRGEGVTTKIIKTAYSTAAGTSFITFDNVFVPDLYHVGPDRDGLQVILSNFNHERWVIISASVAWQRIVVEECLKYVTQRKVFGNTLGSQAVVRSKLAAMISRVEAAQQWLENITYQMNNMTYAEQANELAGPIAFCKLFATSGAQDTARDAVQIFGGRGITKSGMGKFIEHYHRALLIDALGGGAEDVMGDLGVRQALRKMPKSARL